MNDNTAYRFGQEMHASDKYRDRSWEEVETALKNGWEQHVASDASWEASRGVVRQGWDSISPEIDADAYYRTHWNARYANESGDRGYDEHAPAYLFGDEARRLEKYRSHDWDEAEPHLKSDWEARHPGQLSPWEKFKDAVMHGWNRVHPDMD